MAMYLRDLSAVPLLTREGEVALAKRIEAGRRTMLDGLCASLPAMAAVSDWHGAIREGRAGAAPRDRRHGHVRGRAPGR